MARRAVRKVFAPIKYEVEIGEGAYVLHPQPIASITQFDGILNNIMDDLGDFGQRHFIVVYEGEGEDEVEIERMGPMYIDQAEAAQEEMNGKLTRIESDEFQLSSITKAINTAPFEVLKLLIPDLEADDCKGISIPELKWLVALLVEVNGLDWFEAVIKNLGGPLLSEIGAALADWIRLASVQSSVAQITSTATDTTNSSP